ncbi:hypothetical protein [Pseudactinotalea terrae]|uniref:hypothetical protein n=1 Tax=Pseudactinotalea terrae TaxID=1743262 RepID=UPI0012E2A00B|nr:hypothetical protein [Pseudactinotalea terrae]
MVAAALAASTSTLRDVTNAASLTTLQLDEVARGIAETAAAGALDSRESAHRIAALIATSPIIDEVSTYTAGLSQQQRADLADSLRWQLVRTVLDAERGFFDLDRLRTASFAGWLRQTAIAFSHRDAVVRPRSAADRLTVLWDTTPGQMDDTTEQEWQQRHISEHAPVASSAEEQACTGGFWDLVEDPEQMVTKTKGMRAAARTFALSVAVRRSMSLPRLCVPAEETDRQWVLETCQADPNAAARALRAVVELLCGLRDGMPEVDERLLALWDDFSLEQLQSLESAPAPMVDVLVVGQVQPAPKPSRTVLRALRKSAKDLVPSRGWHDIATHLVASFVARTTSPVSDFDGVSDEVSRAALVAEAKRLAQQWPTYVQRALAWPGQPLGCDEEEITDRLARTLHDLTEGSGPAGCDA